MRQTRSKGSGRCWWRTWRNWRPRAIWEWGQRTISDDVRMRKPKLLIHHLGVWKIRIHSPRLTSSIAISDGTSAVSATSVLKVDGSAVGSSSWRSRWRTSPTSSFLTSSAPSFSTGSESTPTATNKSIQDPVAKGRIQDPFAKARDVNSTKDVAADDNPGQQIPGNFPTPILDAQRQAIEVDNQQEKKSEEQSPAHGPSQPIRIFFRNASISAFGNVSTLGNASIPWRERQQSWLNQSLGARHPLASFRLVNKFRASWRNFWDEASIKIVLLTI